MGDERFGVRLQLDDADLRAPAAAATRSPQATDVSPGSAPAAGPAAGREPVCGASGRCTRLAAPVAPPTLDQVLASLAREAVHVLRDHLTRSASAGRPLAVVYLDTSRSANRRWCSMSRCGNRHKVRERRARQAASQRPSLTSFDPTRPENRYDPHPSQPRVDAPNPAFSQGVLVEAPGPCSSSAGRTVSTPPAKWSATTRSNRASRRCGTSSPCWRAPAAPRPTSPPTIYLAKDVDITAAYAAAQEVWGQHATAIPFLFVAALDARVPSRSRRSLRCRPDERPEAPPAADALDVDEALRAAACSTHTGSGRRTSERLPLLDRPGPAGRDRAKRVAQMVHEPASGPVSTWAWRTRRRDGPAPRERAGGPRACGWS